MSAATDAQSIPAAAEHSRGAGRTRPGLGVAIRVEFAKLSAQLPLRILVVLCVVVPVVGAIGLRVSDVRPTDTLFGRWAGTSGFATSLFLLDWAAAWGVAIGAGLIAGDIFASEDRHGTWKTLLTRSSTRTQLFLGKAIAATLGVWLCWALLGVFSIAAGVAIVGPAPLVGLSGQLIPSGHAFVLVLAGWAFGLLPATAYAALGLLFSIASRSSVVGVFGPLLVAIALQALETVGSGEIVRAVMLYTPFDVYHALFTAHVNGATVVQGAIVSILYIAVFSAGAWWLLRRREFAGADAVPANRRRTVIRLGLGVVVIGAVLAVLGGVGPTELTAARLSASVATTFGNVSDVAYQWRTDGKAADTSIPWHATCNRGGVNRLTSSGSGPGDDWSCVITDLRASDGVGASTVDVNVRADGCYEVQSPPGDVGTLYINDDAGKRILNPLYAFDGCLGTP